MFLYLVPELCRCGVGRAETAIADIPLALPAHTGGTIHTANRPPVCLSLYNSYTLERQKTALRTPLPPQTNLRYQHKLVPFESKLAIINVKTTIEIRIKP
jgi:hypothetical protein